MVKLIVYRERMEAATLPGVADCRGNLGGEISEVEVPWCSGNSSPKFLPQTPRSSRGWMVRPTA
jgi:hypothetical protein